jgi:hypothetical protein
MASSGSKEGGDMKTQTMTGKGAWRCIAACATVLAWAASATAQAVVVVGTGDPDTDIPAVQAAVDQGGDVILEGHFSFDRPPTIRPELPGFPLATVRVSQGVAIAGARDEDGEMTRLEAGTIPFYVNAPGARVTMQGLRFVRPKYGAMLVDAVSGFVVATCRIEGVEPVDGFSNGISISTIFSPPTPTQPGQPDRVSGTLVIVHNDIDVAGGTTLDNTLGIVIFSVGVPGAEVEAYVSGNTVRNSTERSINLYQVGGRAYVERNVITTSTMAGPAGGIAPDVIHVVGSGAYLIAHNAVHSRLAKGAGIRVHSQFTVWPIAHAIVVDNDVNMEAPEGTVFGVNSAGIDIWGNAQSTVVLNNSIRGRARAALAVAVFPPPPQPGDGVPANNAFLLNRFDDFEASLADVVVGERVMNTLIVGPGAVQDEGVGTVHVRRGGPRREGEYDGGHVR